MGLGVALLPTPLEAPLAGYGGLRDRLAEGVIDAPEVRALIVADRERAVGALVAFDLVIVRPALRQALEREASARGIDTLLVTATHTHSGPGGNMPGFLAQLVTAGSHDPEAGEKLVTAGVRALERGLADLGRARVASGVARLDLARNRRFEAGGNETALPLLRIDFEDRDPIALFAYGAHPTVLSPANQRYSADYPGAARARLAELGWRSVFVAGPLGDQEPVSLSGEPWPRDLAEQERQMREIGSRLGEAVHAGVAALQPGDSTALSTVTLWFDLPEIRLRRFCPLWWLGPTVSSSVDSFLSRRVAIRLLRIGNALLVGLPSEPVHALGAAIRGRAPRGLHPFVLAHTGDWIGYSVDSESYARGGYEACLSFHGPKFGDRLVDEADAAMQLLPSQPGGSE